MKRACAILAISLNVVLILVWFASLFVYWQVTTSPTGWIGLDYNSVTITSSTVRIGINRNHPSVVPSYFWWDFIQRPTLTWKRFWGELEFTSTGRYGKLELSIPFLIIFLLPLSVGAARGFRFPLWTWFAWTALVGCWLTFFLSQ